MNVYGQENCFNGIDDDGDGLIDLNDPDCQCSEKKVISLIPNPSFEDMVCCPSNRAQMECAETWIQASEATTDYIHTCGWRGWPDYPPPMPFPDGEGIVGFRDGLSRGPNNPDGNPNFKEYAGACLTGPLRSGVTYRFEFWIGFASQEYSPPIDVTIFGASECNALPFGLGNNRFGCPSNDRRWEKLGSAYVSGVNQWIKTSITTRPITDYYAIAIGPSCTEHTRDINPYYFFDNLVLATLDDFEYKIRPDAHPCDKDFSLSVPHRGGHTYQWYKDGIAIVGATDYTLTRVTEEGEYVVRIEADGNCELLPVYKHLVPTFSHEVSETICEGEFFTLKRTPLFENGQYIETFADINGCDSTVILSLSVQTDQPIPVIQKILQGSNLRLGSFNYEHEGRYTVRLRSSIGCDSILDLSLSHYKIYFPNAFSPNGDGINDRFEISLAEEGVEIQELIVYNTWGQPLFHVDNRFEGFSNGWDGRLANGAQALPGTYVYKATLIDPENNILHKVGSLLLFN